MSNILYLKTYTDRELVKVKKYYLNQAMNPDLDFDTKLFIQTVIIELNEELDRRTNESEIYS